MKDDLDARFRTMVTLWVALFLSTGSFFGFTLLSPTGVSREAGDAPNKLLLVALAAVGSLLVLVSFAVKRKLLERSVEKQDVSLVQSALVTAAAMCEGCAVIAVVEHFLLGNREYYLLFLVAATGLLFHFPRRDQLLAATYKTTGKGAAS